MAAKLTEAAKKFDYNPRNHNYAPTYVSGFGITPAPPPLPPLSTKILARTAARKGPHDQQQSPLFNTLYPELRNLVFTYALTEYDDDTRPRSKHSRYYRPGQNFEGKISTSLLLTCRLVYIETHLAPPALNEHDFWIDRNRVKSHSGKFERYAVYFGKMRPAQRAVVERMHIYADVAWLERRRLEGTRPGDVVDQSRQWMAHQQWPVGLVVARLTITIRHMDWRNWRNQELQLEVPRAEEGWGSWISGVPGIKQLVLELEATEGRKDELDKVARTAVSWKFPLVDGAGCLVHNGKKPSESTWLASSALAPPTMRVGDPRTRDAEEERQLDEKHPMTLKVLVRTVVFALE
uniref:Uncharacterized protein n=1 Tax=Mycena chlorophos TaxID=658473 RepID=A0ABQ0LUP6_MYCCL|nr:predicted protein [Mycena chlorophos]